MTLLIRSLTQADRAAWNPLWQGYLTFYKTELPEAAYDLAWARFHDPAEPMNAYGAFLDGRMVGIAHTIYHRSCWTAGDYCYLQDLFTEESYRGRGVGRALMEHVYAVAKAAGASRVHWLTHETNTDAMKLYDRIGAKSGFVQYRKVF
jgi:GNAT superfamily N-acetyltransferase